MYILDQDKMQAGDILLIRSDDETSEKVRKVTGSDYSHAAIIVNDRHYADSDGLGVGSENSMRLKFDKPDEVVVLRFAAITANHLNRITNFAASQISRSYSTIMAKAIRSGKLPDIPLESNRQFCTRFVAQAMQAAGVNIVDDPATCTPQDILNSGQLTVVEDVLKVPDDEELKFVLDHNPFDDKKELLFQMFRAVRKLTKTDIQTKDELHNFAFKHPELDDALTELVKNSGTLEDWKHNFENAPELYSHEKFLEEYPETWAQGQVLQILKFKEPQLQAELNEDLGRHTKAFAHTGHKYFKLHMDYFKKRIRLSKMRENVGNPDYQDKPEDIR